MRPALFQAQARLSEKAGTLMDDAPLESLLPSIIFPGTIFFLKPSFSHNPQTFTAPAMCRYQSDAEASSVGE